MNTMTPDILRQTIKDRAAAVDRAMAADLAAAVTDPELRPLLEHTLLAGGKRIRPLLVLATTELLGGTADGAAMDLALALEYLHAASLLHDDVIDHAEQRRGRACANTIWGNARVILAGDFLHARALTLAAAGGGSEAVAILGRATSAMVAAEFLQHRVAENGSTAKEDYFQVINGKTAALLAAACEAGGLLAGGELHQRQALAAYGTNLGLAFQIVDDLLDYRGEPGKTGKAVGNDYLEGKMTLPLLLALEREGREGRLAELARPPRQAAFLAEVSQRIEEAGGFAGAWQEAERRVAVAVRQLAPFADSPAKTFLLGLAHFVLHRSH